MVSCTQTSAVVSPFPKEASQRLTTQLAIRIVLTPVYHNLEEVEKNLVLMARQTVKHSVTQRVDHPSAVAQCKLSTFIEGSVILL